MPARAALDVAVCLLLLFMPFWMNAIGGYTELAHPHRGHGARGDVAQLPARLHRGALVRPRRLFRARRLRGGDGDQILGRGHDPRHRARRRRRDDRGDDHRRAHRQAARRLFRHGDDRLRPGVLFHRLPLERGDRRRRRAHRLAAPADRFRFRRTRHRQERQGVLLFRSRDFRALRRRDGGASRLAIRAFAGRHSRERAAGAVSRRADRVARLAVVRDLVSLRQRRRGRFTLCSTISSIRGRCASTSPAISSSWRCWAACARSGAR